MVNLCQSNLLPILITLLCCSGLFLFFNLRLNDIKVTVEKQNRVLTSFITNVQQDIKASGGGCMLPTESANHFAAPEALVAARKNEIDKIVVSDDEDDDDDSESESESSSDSDEEGEEKKVINLDEMLAYEVLPSVEETTTTTDSASIIEEPLNLVNLLNVTNLGKTDNANYEQMKVDDLRKIVSDKNLSTKEEVKKLKKPELLVLLKK
jgi:hypothetical protein